MGPESTYQFTPIQVGKRIVSLQMFSGYQSKAHHYLGTVYYSNVSFILSKRHLKRFFEPKEGWADERSLSETNVVSAGPPRGLSARIVSHIVNNWGGLVSYTSMVGKQCDCARSDLSLMMLQC